MDTQQHLLTEKEQNAATARSVQETIEDIKIVNDNEEIIELTPEQIEQIKKYHRIVKLFHFRDFALLFVALEIVLSVAVIALMTWKVIPSTSKVSAFAASFIFFAYCMIVFFGTVHIYLGEASPRLFFKTAMPALAFLVIPALIAGSVGGKFLIWFFAPMRLFTMLESLENFKSIMFSCIIIVVLVMAAFLTGYWINNARTRRRIKW